MRLCYPQVCIWTDPIHKNKLAQIAIFAYKIIWGFLFLDVMINWDRIIAAFKKK